MTGARAIPKWGADKVLRETTGTGTSIAEVTRVFQLLLSVLTSVSASSGLLARGDEVRLEVPGTKWVQKKTVIDETGQVELGVFGKVHLAEQTIESAELRLRQHLSTYLRNVEGVRLELLSKGRWVRFTGLVVSPGVVRLRAQDDLWKGVHLAGGARPDADLAHVIILREDARIEVDLRAYLTGSRIGALPPLQSGDTVLLPAFQNFGEISPMVPAERSRAAHVVLLGAVRTPGIYPLGDRLEPLTALGQGGGPTPDADLSSVRVIGRDHSTRVDVRARLRDGVWPKPLPLIREGPVTVFVPPKQATSADSLVRSVTVMGSVVRPGSVPAPHRLSLLDALALAGGPSEYGEMGGVQLIRRMKGVSMTSRYNLEERINKGAPPIVLEPGDQVLVERRKEDELRVALEILGSIAAIAGVATLIATQVSE